MPRKPSTLVIEKTKKTVKNIPSSESGSSVLCKTKNGTEYTVSQNPIKERLRFSLWKHTKGSYEKIATAESPTDLYSLIEWKK